MLFVSIFDEDIVKEEVFLQWKCSKTPANQTGKDAVLKSVGTFFAQLQDKKLENTGLWSVIVFFKSHKKFMFFIDFVQK